MTENEILIKAADTIDEKVCTLKISTTEVVKKHTAKHRLLGFKWGEKEFKEIIPVTRTYHIRPATLRTMVRISGLVVGMEVEAMPDESNYMDWVLKTVSHNSEVQAKIVATAIHNDKTEVPKELSEIILDSFTAEDLWKVFQVVIDKLNIIPFMNTITSVKSIQVLKTETVSPTDKEEIIASGEQSEVLSNIFASATIIQ